MPKLITILFGSFVFLIPSVTFGFPELIRHGYSQCIACHISPTGGGTLTPYGRSLSGEIMSQWASPEEYRFLYGALKTPKWINFGGDMRAVQTYRNNVFVEEYKFIMMQADLEAAATLNKNWLLDISAGYSDFPTPSAITRRHYLIFKVEDAIALRVGKFAKAFGINTAEHTIETKRGLGWNEGMESYNFEASWLLEQYDLFVTLDLGRPDKPDLLREKGIALHGARNIGERYKAGVSYYYGDNSNQSRHVFGPWGLLGFSRRLFLLSEIDFQRVSPKDNSGTRFGMVSYSRLGYEVIRALNLFVTYEFSKLDLSNPIFQRTTLGGGIQFFPRPHLEMSLFYEKQSADSSIGNTELGWLLLHYYL